MVQEHLLINGLMDKEIRRGSRQFCVGGVQKFRFFFCFTEGRGSVPIFLAGHHWPASITPFQWHFAGGPMMATGDGVIEIDISLHPY